MSISNPVALLLLCAALSQAAEVSFNRQIRPILSDNCYACHGFDEKHRKAELRLDVRESALEVKDGAAAIVPGNPAKSTIWQRIISDDPEQVMPTPESHKPPLNSEQRALIKRWIEEGAKYEPHWSFTATGPTRRPCGKRRHRSFRRPAAG